MQRHFLSLFSNYVFFLLFLLHSGQVLGRSWLIFVCSISNLFLAICSFSQHSHPVSGSDLAVNGLCWTMLIESGSMPDLAPCHISTEHTLSQVQILAAGHFLAEGVSCPSQTYTHMGTQTQTPHRYMHMVAQTLICAETCKPSGQMRHRLIVVGWFWCEHVNDRHADKNNQTRPSVFSLLRRKKRWTRKIYEERFHSKTWGNDAPLLVF